MIGFGATFGYTTVKYFSRPNEKNRQLASLTYSKLGIEHFSRDLFDVKIKNESLAQKADEVSEITVTIESLKAFPAGLTYTWNLPDTATLIDGAATGDLQDFAAEQTKEFRIKVKGYSNSVQNFISFTVKGTLNEQNIERDVLVSSRPEDSFEYVVQENEKARAIKAKAFNKMGEPAAKSPINLDKVSF